MKTYLDKLNQHLHNEFTLQLEEEALKQQVPIMELDGIANLRLLIEITRAKKILEIGTAVGYSAIQMARSASIERIDTIERNPEMVLKANENIRKAGFLDIINVIESDALEVSLDALKIDYDLILIDAAKAQYQKFFEKFTPLLKVGGIVVTDNIFFHGLVEDQTNLSKNVLHLVKKIASYNEYLTKQQNFSTYYFKIGDGQAISIKKE